MKHEATSRAELKAWFAAEVERLWPIAVGSLSLRKCPCVRSNCPACATGEKHASHVLYVRQGGKRHGIYVPDELVPQVRLAVANERRLRTLLADVGIRLVGLLKSARSARR